MGLKDIFLGAGQGIIEGIGNVADKFIQTKDEKAAFDLKVEEIITTRLTQIQESVRTQMTMTLEVIKAEMASGDNYTKRARPTIVYFGLLVIAWNYCILPYFHLPPVELPGDFWLAWGGVVGVWSAGRSAEKIGVQGKVTSAITGNKYDF